MPVTLNDEDVKALREVFHYGTFWFSDTWQSVKFNIPIKRRIEVFDLLVKIGALP